MSGLRLGQTREFRPTRTTRSSAAAAGASATGLTTATANSSRARSTTRPGSAVGFVPGTTRIGTGSGASRASAPAGPATGATATAGVKRKTRATSSGPGTGTEQEPVAAKRPALSSAFSAHVTQTSQNRQLLDAQAQITKLQHNLLDKQREIDRLEADLRLVATREEEEKGARARSEEELAQKTSEYERELSSLKAKLSELEADHEDLDDAYSSLSHTSQSQIASLNLELTTRDERISLLEAQLKDAEAKAHQEQIRAKELEELLEQVAEEGTVAEGSEEEGEEHRDNDSTHDARENRTDTNMRIEIKEPESSVADTDDQANDLDADAEGEAEEEGVPMAVENTESDVTPTGEIDIFSSPSDSVAEANVFYEGGPPEIEAYPDPGAPPRYAVSSPPTHASPRSVSTSMASRSRSASIASSNARSIASSRAMSITLDGPPLSQAPRSSGTPISIASSSRLDPLSHVRRRLSLATPNRRRSSAGPSSERERDNEIIRAELARQTSHITALEATNARLTSEMARLRDRAEGTEVLREEKRELERRVEGMETLRSRVAELETAATEFACREREWQARLREREQFSDENATPAKTPVGVTRQLAALRKAHAALLDEHGELKATLRVNEVELSTAREEAESASRNTERLQKQMEHLQDALARKEKEHTLLEQDVTFLRSLVSSYKNEETANTSMEISEHPRSAGGTEKLEGRVAQLETLLMDYKATIESLEKEVERLERAGRDAANRPQELWDQLLNRATTLEEAFKNAQAEVTRQTEYVEELEQRLFELGGEIGGGRHIPPGTRVLSLRQNPAQEWADTRKEVLDRLKAENEALLARLKELEEKGLSTISSTSDTSENAQFVPRESWEALKKETEEQQAALAQKEKRLLRLKQVYTAKSVEFREAIESILGLKLAFYPNGQVRLTSVYDLSATFVFQPSQEGVDRGGAKLQLIATGDEGPQELEGLMNIWIRDEMCIPCFMSSVTLECYDRWKHEQRAARLL